MKKQKHILLLIVLSVLLFSFTEREPYSLDPLIGDWMIVKYGFVLEDGSVIENESSVCSKKMLFSYKEDGILQFTRYKLNKETNECDKMPDDFWTGVWYKNGDKYYVKAVNKFSETNIIHRGVDSIKTYTFYDNNNKLKTYEDHIKSGVIWDGDNPPIGEFGYFERILKK